MARFRIRISACATLALVAGCSSVDEGRRPSVEAIVVTSAADTVADDGRCTFREAIVSANDGVTSGRTSGECAGGDRVASIIFRIAGESSFTIDGEHGYTVHLTAPLPALRVPILVDGYSQPGSRANEAAWPAPFDGRLLVEIDGSGASGSGIELYADDIVVRGLVINSFGGTALLVGGDGVLLRGNYVGTDPTGLTARANVGNGVNAGVGTGNDDPDGLIIGGADPGDRNIVSANAGAGITPNTGDDGWVIQGNYVGMAADGITPLGNSTGPEGPGGLSIDNCADAVVGGPGSTEGNLISGNLNFGILPDNTQGLVVQGNRIGGDWRGNEVEGSPQAGGIGLFGIVGPVVDSLIGGVDPRAGNVISWNRGPAIVVADIADAPMSTVHNSSGNTIIGNSIHDNEASSLFGVMPLSDAPIDLLTVVLTLGEGAGNLGSYVGSEGVGPTPNDLGDVDDGPNGLLNTPVIGAVVVDGSRLKISFGLDASRSPTGRYRVEFFANRNPADRGGERLLGAVEVNSGSGLSASLARPANLPGELFVTATATIVTDDPSGFGSTSEFAATSVATAP